MSVTCQKMNRRELLNYINELSFAVDDTLQLPVSLISGPGSMSHGHGRKEAAEYVEL